MSQFQEAAVPDAPLVTYLFSDIAGSTRLWESDPDAAATTLAWHDELCRSTVKRHGGTLVKMRGDGMHAAFDDAAAAAAAAVDLQVALAVPHAGVSPLSVRFGLHAGADQQRDGDFFGPAVNRAARITDAANGGQILVSGTLAEQLRSRLPQDVGFRDLGLVRLKDLTAPEHLFQLVHPLLRSEFPPLRSLASIPNNLPEQLDSFVGREGEVATLREQLLKSRLVVVVAVGGIGKSRLSLQLGAEVLHDFPDGVWLVELAALQPEGDVAQAVAAVLGVKQQPGGGIADALVEFAKGRRLLLILDNCEHVVGSAAALAKRLLQRAPELKILASSRNALRIAGESLYHLDALPVPSFEDTAAHRLLQYPAAQLFVDRASAVQHRFRLTDATAAAVIKICRSLDGIPLALELAAARMRSLTVEQIAERLDERFRLLQSADGTVLPRQRSLRALIDWSHELLSERERIAFRRLAAFAGGWTLEAAEAVLAGDGIDSSEVLDLVGSLVEKSLASLLPHADHYRMLDTVRHYALERLQQANDEASTRERHLAYFVDLAEKARPHLQGAEQGDWLARLDGQRENFFAAMAWCDQSPHGADAGASLVGNLKYYWLSRGMFGTAYTFAVRTVERAAAAGGASYGRSLVDAGTIATFLGKYKDARTYYTQGLERARADDHRQRELTTHLYLGEVEFAFGNHEAAIEHCQRAEDIARAGVNPRELATALNTKAQLFRALGRVEEAEPLYVEALTLARNQGDQEQIASGLLNLTMVAVLQERADLARELLIEAYVVVDQIGSQAAGQALLEACAGLAAVVEDWRTAACLLAAAHEQARRSGLGRDPADQAFFDDIDRRVRRAGAQPSGGRPAMSYDAAMAVSLTWLNAPALKAKTADPAPAVFR